MTKIVSTINLKGGVGKTTTTIALAEFIAAQYFKKVLLVDLDPQTNASISLIGEDRWKEKNAAGQTIYQLFADKMHNTAKFEIRDALEKRVSPLEGGIHDLDLLPSSLDLVDIQDSLAMIGVSGTFVNPIQILNSAIGTILKEYDYVLIDCPPNLGLITLNGLLMSDYYLIPCIPDYLSTYGIPQIIKRVNRFKQDTGAKILPLGIVINMYRKQTNLHKATVEMLHMRHQQQGYPRIFSTMIPHTTKVEQAVEYADRSLTMKQKYGDAEVIEAYKTLTGEFLQYVRQ